MIRFFTLGKLDLRGAESVEMRAVLQQPKRLGLLAYLAVASPRRFHRRDTLLGLFWPELDQEHARAALRRSLYFLRAELGAGVIFQVAGGCGLGALDAAKEKGVWGIGVDADQAFLGPHILTSAVKRVDTAVFLAIKSVVDGEFKGGTNMTFGLKQNGVGVGKISSKVPKADVDKLNQIRVDIISGKIKNIPTEVQQ